jgi:hypothetical protein
MGVRKIRRQPVSLANNSRWVAYAAAGAASAAVAGAARADIHYFAPMEVFHAGPGANVTDFFALGALDSFALRHAQFSGSGSGHGFAGFVIFGNGQFNGNANGNYRYPYKLLSGANISAMPFVSNRPGTMPGQKFFATLASQSFFGRSQWLAAGTGYVGFRFNDGGGFQYGWARIKMDSGAPLNNFTLVSYAYGDLGTPVVAGQTAVPEPGSLGLLAIGAAGVLLWRRQRAKAAA